MSLWQDFKNSPTKTIANWQDERFLWIVMAVVMIALVLVAHSLFQNYFYMLPCEQCVYIRYSMLVMAIGGIVAAINPKVIILKLIGYILGIYGAVVGMGYCIKLHTIHKAVHSDDPFGVQGCSAEPTFAFNLPLDKWAPDWFKPTGDCGFDSPIVPDGAILNSFQQFFIDLYSDGWYLIPSMKFMDMAQCCFIAYGVAFVLLVIMAICWIINLKKA